MNWIAVFIGGGVGALTRWQIFRAMNRFIPTVPVWISTFIVNAIGCFLIGLLFAYVSAKNMDEQTRLLLFTGFLGGLTTFSALGLDVFQLIQQRSFVFGSAYFLIHGIFCIFLVYTGYWAYSLR